MQSYNDLQSQLKTIDHKSYPLYKSLRGSYQFPKYILSIDHVQGDPFAAPSDVRVTVDAKAAGFPAFAMKDKLTRTALADELLRNFAAKVNQFNFKAKGSGKSGLISVTHCGQEVLQRTACEISEKEITARFAVGFPANGRTINAKELEKILFEYLPQCVEQSFYYKNLNAQKVKEAVELAEDQQAIREKLESFNHKPFQKRERYLFQANEAVCKICFSGNNACDIRTAAPGEDYRNGSSQRDHHDRRRRLSWKIYTFKCVGIRRIQSYCRRWQGICDRR